MRSLVVTTVVVPPLVCLSVFGQEPCTGNSLWDIPGKVMDRATHTVGARDDWNGRKAYRLHFDLGEYRGYKIFTRLPKTAPQLFVVEVGSLGRRKELSPYQLRIRDQSLADIDLNALVALLPK